MSTESEQKQWFDIKLKDHDIDLDVAGIPHEVIDRDTIAQDIQSMLYDSGLLFELIGDRNRNNWQTVIVKMINVVENDQRIIPGTVDIKHSDKETLWLIADSVKGPIDSTLDITSYSMINTGASL